MLESKIPVQSGRVVLLDHEARCLGRSFPATGPRAARRLCGLLEVPLARVLIEFLCRHCRIDSAQIAAYACRVGLGTPWKAALLLAVGAAGGAAAVAVASVPDSSGVIHACVALSPASGEPVATGPNLRIIDTSAGQACGHPPPGAPTTPEQSITWNVTGPQGPPGTNGAAGAPGKTVTLLGGNTLTLPGGQIIHVGQSPGLTINPPAVGNKAVATFALSDGQTTITSALLGFGFAVSSAGATGSAKRTTVHNIQITKHVDKSSAKLFQACVTGKHFNKAKIVFSKGGHSTVYSLTNVLVASAQAGSVKGSSQPTETLTLNYTKIEFKHT